MSKPKTDTKKPQWTDAEDLAILDAASRNPQLPNRRIAMAVSKKIPRCMRSIEMRMSRDLRELIDEIRAENNF